MPTPDFTPLLSPMPEAVQLISELLKTAIFNQADLTKEVTVLSGIKYRKKVGFLGKMGMIGMKSLGSCTLNQVTAALTASEKEWTPEPYDSEIKYCAEDYAETIGQLGLKDGIEIFDMMNTPVMNLVAEYLQPAFTEMYNRLLWMADKTAAHTDDSPAGEISPAVDLKFVNMQNGLWKRAAAIFAAHPTQLIAIAANNQATYALQDSTFTPALALAVANDLYFKAPRQIKQVLKKKSPAWYYKCTTAFFDKLIQNFQGVGGTVALDQMRINLENGLQGIKINGVAFVEDPTMDELIEVYNNTGVKLIRPYRVILMSKENAVMGVPNESTFGFFDMFYSKEQMKVIVRFRDEYDTMWLQDSLVMGAM